MSRLSTSLRRFESLPEARPNQVRPLRDDHSAVVNGHTIFPKSVVNAEDSPRLFVSGKNNRKIGGQVQKGEWAGMPIYMLTLEERATCPSYCSNWSVCYGNAMHWARRHRHGPELEAKIVDEIYQLSDAHPKGFVVRLHVLGDFYSSFYVHLWDTLLLENPALHIFGYTARFGCEIADTIKEMNARYPARCFIRTTSKNPKPGGAAVVTSAEPISGAIICPAELSKTDCCSTCGLCWAQQAREKAILFILHGNPGRGTAKPKTEAKPMTDDTWIELKPIHTIKPTQEPRVTFSVAILGGQKNSMAMIGLNAALCEQMDIDRSGKGTAKIDFGTGKNAGLLRIEQSSQGAFKLATLGTKSMAKGVRLQVRVPNQTNERIERQVLQHRLEGKVLFVTLPETIKDASSAAPAIKPNKELLDQIEGGIVRANLPPFKELPKMAAPPKPDAYEDQVTAIVVSPSTMDLIKQGEAGRVEAARRTFKRDAIKGVLETQSYIKKVHEGFTGKPVQPDTKEAIQETPNQQAIPKIRLQLIGRILMLGTTPHNLFADEVPVAKKLVDRFGQTLTKKEAEAIERNAAIPIKRLQSRLKDCQIVIEDRRDGWAFANSVKT